MKQTLRILTITLAVLCSLGGCLFPRAKKQQIESSQIKGASDDQPTRLKVSNQCDQPIWVEYEIGTKGLTMPGDVQNRRLAPGESLDYPLPNAKVESLRLWPKTGCDAGGRNCDIGESRAPCSAQGCQPPIESKFEATFASAETCGDNKNADCVTWYNASQVDGYTLPYAIYPKGNKEGVNGCEVSRCDIDVNTCPSDELIDGRSYDLKVIGKNSKQVVGCIAPCKKLNYPAPWGEGKSEASPGVDFMCCPTPPITPGACSAGPIEKTKYVNHIRNVCKNVYTYAYDDANGLHTCSATTKFEVVFCPKGGPAAGSRIGAGGDPAGTPTPTPNPTPNPNPPPQGQTICDTDPRVNRGVPYRYDETCKASGGAGCIADLPCRYNQ